MPLFHIQWRVAHGPLEFTAYRDVDWGFVPSTEVEVVPFDGAAPVEVERVLLNVGGSDGDLILRTFEPLRAEQFEYLKLQLPGHGWRLR
jgi:hypothetical protein